MAQVLFGQSYYLRFDAKLYAPIAPYPPLGTLYSAAYIRERGHSVGMFDAMLAESEKDWEEAVFRHRPRYAVLFEDNFNYLSKMCLARMRQAAFQMITAGKSCGSRVIVCGADATDHHSRYLDQGADFVLLGEGEETLGELLDALEGRTGQSVESVAGLAWKEVSGQHRSSPKRPQITQLDELPPPAWDLIDTPRYRQLWRLRHGYYSLNMATTRGCPFHCNWCAKPIWGQRYNCRSPENVVGELQWLKQHVQPDHIWFADDIFGLKPGWVERFGALVHQHSAALPFKCMLRPDLVTPSLVDGLRLAGCRSVWLGAESGSQKILDAMEKGTTVEQIHQACGRLQAAGIEVGFFIQYGYPGENTQDIQETLAMIRRCLPDDIGISVSYPLPGTAFHEKVRSQLGEKRNWIDSEDMAMLYRGPYPESFYRVLYRATHSEFRMRRAWLRLKRDAGQPAKWSPHHIRWLLTAARNGLRWPVDRFRLNREMRSAARHFQN
jgi:anaerobic magnesium-protoporphyrin IX monomethyl ester cyclase